MGFGCRLVPGTQLQEVEPELGLTVTSVVTWRGSRVVYNLTIQDIHTYYVLAGNTPILVHDTGGGNTPPIAVIGPSGEIIPAVPAGAIGT
ncbi:hypothetical protein F4553_008093, partial [Allocatelliglobosispora scoriae]|nr:hypothetical protein [Allocatelliglobosispora scoriae]